MTRLAAFLGLDDAGFDAAFDHLAALRREAGIPNTLAELGVEAEHVGELTKKAVADPTAGTNPVPLTEDTVRELITRALTGQNGAGS